MLEVNNLHKRFGKPGKLGKKETAVDALRGVSFKANDGQITGILGPNGAGKTTCIRVLYGLLQADQGTASIDGIDVSQFPLDARRQLGIFPDKFGLFERLTAREQIAYFAALHGLKGQDQKQAVDEVIHKLQIEDLAERRSVGFSQGQRMKVTLAQTLVHKPKNLVLDEPTRGLDVMSTRLLRDQLRELKQAGHCILFSTHVMQEVAALCDNVLIMANGQLVAQGTPQQLCQQAGEAQLEDAFVKLIGSDEGIAA